MRTAFVDIAVVHQMKNSITAGMRWALCAGLLLALNGQADDKKADATGKWTWTTPGRNGGPERKSILTLKVEGEKVTGKISSPGRDGQERETEIADGKLSGAEVFFTVTREYNGNKMVAKYSGKVGADKITGKIGTERNGEAQSRDWEATRVVEKK